MCVVVLDDATDSGETMLRLVDIVQRMGGARIYGYVLINRGAAYSVRKLENLKKYDAVSTHIRYLAEAQLPSYVSETCPVCNRRQKLARLVEGMEPELGIAKYVNEVIEALSEQSATAIGRGLERTRGTPYQTADDKKLLLRCLLAEAEVEPELRHELTKALKEYRADSETAVALLCVLANEDVLPSNPLHRNSRIFYSSFIEAVRAISKALVGEEEFALSPDELGAVLTVANAFHEGFSLEYAQKLLSITSGDERAFFRVALCFLESTACQANPGVMAAHYARLYELQPGGASPVQQLCDEMRHYWQRVSKERAGQNSFRLAAYRELLGGRSHDLDHQHRDLLMKIEDRIGKELPEHWGVYRSTLIDILSRVRLVISSGVSTDLCNTLDNKCAALVRQLKDLDALMASRVEKSKDVDENEFRNLFRRGAKDTKLVWADIGSDLNKLRTNLKESVYVVLLNCGEDLEKRHIDVVRRQPPGPCFVFGESSDIRLALNNLVDNVVNWSGGHRLVVTVEVDGNNDFIHLRMYDDGVGASDDLFSGIGLVRVKEIATALHGRFKLSRVREGDEHFREGFRTVAELSLPTVSVKGNPV